MTFMLFSITQGAAQDKAAVNAQKEAGISQTIENPTPGKFIDKDKDGVCDNFQSGIKNGRGQNFVDKDGDGACDNRGTLGKKNINLRGCGMGYQHRRGHGKGTCCGSGHGYQHRHGRSDQNNSPAIAPEKKEQK